MKDYSATYAKDPFNVDLKVHSIKAGLYHIVGEIEAENWKKACTDIGVLEGGSCKVDVDIEKSGGFLKFTGSIDMETMRTCSRTLEEFMLSDHFEIEDSLCLAAEKAGEMDELFEEDELNIGEFLLQQIIIHMDPYPTHPKTKMAENGAFDVTDGLQEEEIAEKNPFSVLKHLKS